MANFGKYKGKWCKQVRRKGFVHESKTFHDVKEGNKFALPFKSEMEHKVLYLRIFFFEAGGITLREILVRWRNEKTTE